jgi:hypothetical protein
MRPVYSIYKQLINLRSRAEGGDDAPPAGAAGGSGPLAAARRGRAKQQNLLYYLKEVFSYAALQVRACKRAWCACVGRVGACAGAGAGAAGLLLLPLRPPADLCAVLLQGNARWAACAAAALAC